MCACKHRRPPLADICRCVCVCVCVCVCILPSYLRACVAHAPAVHLRMLHASCVCVCMCVCVYVCMFVHVCVFFFFCVAFFLYVCMCVRAHLALVITKDYLMNIILASIPKPLLPPPPPHKHANGMSLNLHHLTKLSLALPPP
jgi:hypothetical protein